VGSARDYVYRETRRRVEDFKFDRSVATAFDDMVTRSVPFYAEIQRMVGDLAADFAVADTSVYDLGCSIGTTSCN
jgi:tRNA (cmo5U34)-methyltransferase